jgi:WhiB family redox-sensing transcriptional regulator
VTLEATCRPDTVRDAQAIPSPRETELDVEALLATYDVECVEDALAAGIALPCQDQDPDLFFADSPVEVERAKAFCTDCPVKALCLAAALERREPWGVWGGEWFVAGEAVGRKRPRGRPRKDGSTGPRPAVRPARSAPRREVAA